MGQQSNKVIKRRRRKLYVARKKARIKAGAGRLSSGRTKSAEGSAKKSVKKPAKKAAVKKKPDAAPVAEAPAEAEAPPAAE